MFPLANSSLTTSSLPWFMDLTFQIPMQYCSLWHQTLFSPPDTSTPVISALAQPLHSFWSFLCSCPVAYWTPTDLGGSSSSVVYFFLFIPFMGFTRPEYWSGLPFLLQWTVFCQNSPLWPIHLGWPCMAWLIASLNYTRLWFLWSFWLASVIVVFVLEAVGL